MPHRYQEEGPVMLPADRHHASHALAWPGDGNRTHSDRTSLTAQARNLYRSLLRQGKVPRDELPSLAMAPAGAESALDELTNLGLIFSEDGWVTAIPHHHVVDALLAQ